MEKLTHREQMRLFQFVCTFAWTDLKVTPAEREFVQRLMGWMRLGEEDCAQVERWLIVPPNIDEVDPATVPFAHRELFVEAATAMIETDGRVPAEDDALKIFRELVELD